MMMSVPDHELDPPDDEKEHLPDDPWACECKMCLMNWKDVYAEERGARCHCQYCRGFYQGLTP